MRIYHGYENVPSVDTTRHLCIGTFDGVHRGHQQLIKRTVDSSNGGESGALIFDPHPRSVVSNDAPALIATLEERLALMKHFGLDFTIVVPFTRRFAQIEAEDFVRDILVNQLEIGRVVVGYNFRFGYRGKGSTHTLQALATECGYKLETVDAVTYDGSQVSSTRIRQAIAEARVGRAAQLLNHPYTVRAKVIEGAKRGRSIGFPTANMRFPKEKVAPAMGVYAVRVRVEGDQVEPVVETGAGWPAVANFGLRPTFPDQEAEPLLEVHLLEREPDLYGQTLAVAFIERLRAEKQFDSVSELKEQIAADVKQARAILLAPS